MYINELKIILSVIYIVFKEISKQPIIMIKVIALYGAFAVHDFMLHLLVHFIFTIHLSDVSRGREQSTEHLSALEWNPFGILILCIYAFS